MSTLATVVDSVVSDPRGPSRELARRIAEICLEGPGATGRLAALIVATWTECPERRQALRELTTREPTTRVFRRDEDAPFTWADEGED